MLMFSPVKNILNADDVILNYHGCTLSVLAYYIHPGLLYYTQPGVRIRITFVT
jgi:hypothetical protein